MADSYGRASRDRADAERNIAEDRGRGKPATKHDLEKRGDAITRQADQAKPPKPSKRDPDVKKSGRHRR